METFSTWHWIIIVIIAILVFAQVRRAAKNLSIITGSNLVYSITSYIIAALHDGALPAQATIDRLSDRHRAKLPELGIDTEKILLEAKKARLRDCGFGIIYLVISIWLLEKAFDFPLIEEGVLLPLDYLDGLLSPLLAIAALGVAKTLTVNRYLHNKIKSIDGSIDLEFTENVIIFGGFSPFAGFGDDLDGWSFTINTTRPVENSAKTPEAFTQKQLLDFVILQLQTTIQSSFRADLSFVSGRHIRGNAKFLSSHTAAPISKVANEDIQAEIGRPDSTWRHYRSLTIPISGGHLALTFFLRSTNIGTNTFIESRCFILRSIKSEYTSLNDLSARTGFSYLYRLVRSEIVSSPISWFVGSTPPLAAIIRGFRNAKFFVFGDREDKLKKRDVLYNYGHTKSFRETLASDTYQTYFQIVDKDRIAKTVQYITLNSIVDFLDARGVATDEIKERRTQIFNSGVIVSGGVLNAQQLAVGSGAIAKISGVMSALKSKGVGDVK